MIATATLSCPRCEMACRQSVEWIQPNVGIWQCGLIFTDRPLTRVDRFVAGQARALTMAWAARPPFGEPPWPWTSTRPPQVAVGPPRAGDGRPR